MPASQSFDERHLQDVVLAQSGEIRPANRFSGLRSLVRPVVALAAVVAFIAIGLGIKDYVGQQNANSTAGTVTPAVEHPNAITRLKKSTSGKTVRTRTSATDATAEETAPSANAAAEMETPPISEQSSDPGAKQTTAMENQSNTLTAEAARDGMAAVDGTPNAHDTIVKPGSSACLPLPNGTKPEDVDAPYYFRWATEYCGRDLSRPSTPPKVRKSQPSKR